MHTTSPTSNSTRAALGWSAAGRLIAGVLLLRLAALLAVMAALIPIQSDISFPEGALVARAMDVARGETPYHDWRQWPHHFAPYPPLAYYPAGWAARVLDCPTDTHAIYMLGRLMSYAWILGIFGMVYLLARRSGLPAGWSLCAMALLASFVDLLKFCTSFRPDAPKTFFALLALWIAARGRATRVTAAAALGCLLVSAWFKPTAWAVGLGIAWWVWRGLGRRRALAVGGAFLAAGVVPLWLLNRYWHGLLLLNIVDSLRNGLELNTLLHVIRPMSLLPLLLLAGGGLAGLAGWRLEARPGARLILAVAPLSLLACGLQLLKVGADINYFLDCFPLAVLAVAWLAHRLWQGELRLPVRWRAALGGPLLLLLLAVVYHAALDVTVARDCFENLRGSWPRLSIQKLARQAPGPLLSLNSFVALESPAPTILDHFQFQVLCQRGAINPESLLERVRGRQFSAIILRNDDADQDRAGGETEFFCKGFSEAVTQYYPDRRDYGIYRICLPLAGGEAREGR